jgi:hypothetical protein
MARLLRIALGALGLFAYAWYQGVRNAAGQAKEALAPRASTLRSGAADSAGLER